MKAVGGRYGKQASIQKAVSYACNQKYDEIFDEIQDTIARQLVAAMLYTLEVNEGYGEKRIKRVVKELSGTFADMGGVGFAGQFDALDLVDRLKEKYGIDLKKEISVGKHENRR